ncbi:hypothetical protein [Algoriphagus sp.]|uniref:hypothetical protein n=1 Tax=Algoriphagus sp. TaxID=1872435 RepID=UPI0026051B90|nr:hypothetical protein [Algoriphagus sp.]
MNPTKKITKREIIAFILGIVSILTLDTSLNWDHAKDAFQSGYEDGYQKGYESVN